MDNFAGSYSRANQKTFNGRCIVVALHFYLRLRHMKNKKNVFYEKFRTLLNSNVPIVKIQLKFQKHFVKRFFPCTTDYSTEYFIFSNILLKINMHNKVLIYILSGDEMFILRTTN